MENVLLLTIIISFTLVFKTVININFGNNKPNKRCENQQPTVIVVQPALPANQDDSSWLFLVLFGLIGFLMYLYLLSPKLFTDLFLIGS